ncbi:HAD family hydrolase [Mobilitalea sibirica]|uniref:HAD family hydrolase n=1 Tax=Mobilitalea sibirica TaxID=1462919 RepID=A0A8J7KXK0_9FIRM|nr:HAD family hydrolase [Mobilitalea sibirica]MBH1941877.1 HAD family hydrolase [Mobilitalea sibirica]
MKEYILIDLDGTLTNPKLGITKSMQYALKSRNIIVDDLDTLTKHIGPPLKEGIMESYGFNEEETEKAIKKFREYFEETGIFENEVYEGIELLLSKLKEAGKMIIVATSKPEVFARKILEHFHIEVYFDDICGAAIDDTRSKKEEVIRYALERNRIADLDKVVMVGDRKYDIEGAKAVGIASIGVLYGFGSKEELMVAGADGLAETVDELYDVIIHL